MTAQNKHIWQLIGLISLLLLLFVPFSAAAFRVTYDYTLVMVAAGGALLGVLSGVLGCFSVLRQQSLMGDALSHAALPGVCIAFLVAGRDMGWLLLGAGIAGWLGTLFINRVTATTRLKQDAAMGIVLAAWFAFGIALLAYIQGRPDASQAGLDRFIFGQAAAIVQRDVEMILIVGLVIFAVLALFWKEFKLITFDPEFAAANGFPLRWLDMLLSSLVVVAIVLGLQLAGVILMVGLLIGPAVAARQWTHHLGQMVVLAGVFGAFSGGTGAIISAVEVGLPTGPLIIVVASVIVLISILFAPERGVVWSLLQQQRDHQRFLAQNILYDLSRWSESHGGLHKPMPQELIVHMRGGGSQRGLQQLMQQGLVQQSAEGWTLTESGSEQTQTDHHSPLPHNPGHPGDKTHGPRD